LLQQTFEVRLGRGADAGDGRAEAHRGEEQIPALGVMLFGVAGALVVTAAVAKKTKNGFALKPHVLSAASMEAASR
jgi:hypothetical protein